jgi:hypothetical protein
MDCPKAIHNLMLDCWQKEQAHRPAFTAIVATLDKLIWYPALLKDIVEPENSSASHLILDISSPKWEVGFCCEVLLKVAKDIDCIYVQEVTEELNKIQKELKEYSKFSIKPSTIPDKGSYIAIKSDDGDLYRAQITDVNGEDITVIYVDFGNSSTLSQNGESLNDKIIDGFKQANLLTPGEPGEEDPLSDAISYLTSPTLSISDPLAEPPFFGFTDSRELSEEQRQTPTPKNASQEETTKPPLKKMVPLRNAIVKLKKLTQRDLRKAGVKQKLLKKNTYANTVNWNLIIILKCSGTWKSMKEKINFNVQIAIMHVRSVGL